MGRRAWAAVCAMTLGGALCSGGCAAAGPRGGAAIEPISDTSAAVVSATAPMSSVVDTSKLRVMSFNLRVPFVLDLFNYWDFRKAMLVRTILRFEPDLLGTQECKWGPSRYLVENLPGYRFVGAGRDDGKRRGEMCGVFYRADRFQELGHGFFWLSTTPTRPSKSWGSWFTRMATWVKLRKLDDGTMFYFFDTHLDSNSSGARLEQARMLRRAIATIAGEAPVVLTGDFNTDADSAPHHALVQAGGERLVDAYARLHPGGAHQGSFHKFTGYTGGDRIDWILTTPSVAVLASNIDHDHEGIRYPSDHFPVTAVLQLPTTATAAVPQKTADLVTR